MSDSCIKAYGHCENIVVNGCEPGENITVYDIDGVRLRTQYADGNTVRIAMPSNAIYLVEVGDVTVKVAL